MLADYNDLLQLLNIIVKDSEQTAERSYYGTVALSTA